MTLLDPAERSARGAAIAADVTGAPLPTPTTPYSESWRDFIFAEIWSRPGLDRRSRFFIAIASAAATTATSDQVDRYVRGALTTGEITLPELREAALHLSVYIGWTKGAELENAITRVVAELGLTETAYPPIRAEPWDAMERGEQGAKEFLAVMTFGGPGYPPPSPYQEAIRNFVFGEMWNRPGLDQRARRWMTVVGVCESCAQVPIKSHIHAAMASGNCTADEMQEFVLQYGVHAGWPRASEIQGVVFEMAKKFAAGLPWNG